MGNKSALIFGANGQDGFYLNQLLLLKGVHCVNVSRSGSSIIGDVGDYSFVENVIKKYIPHYIFHIAANSSTNHSDLFENHQTICLGTLNVLEAVRLYCPDSRIFIAGSALQFLNEGTPIDEGTPFFPSSGYAVARIQSTFAARYYRETFSMKIYIGYFFNHDSPLRSEKHVNQKIVHAAQSIAGGRKEKLVLGNIEVKKEFNFAGDIVAATWEMINQEKIFEAVIGSGVAYSIQQWVEYCFGILNLEWQDYIELDEKFIPEYEILVSNPGLIMQTGWKPIVNIFQLADMMIKA